MCSREIRNGVKSLQEIVKELQEQITKLEQRLSFVEGKSNKTTSTIARIQNQIKDKLSSDGK